MRNALTATAAALFGAMMAAPPASASDPLSAQDRLAVTETVTGVGLFSDLRDWDRVVSLLADELTTDYVGVFGGEPARAPGEQVVAGWRATLEGFDATQHLITNVAVDGSGDSAQTLSHVRATHWLGERHWTLGGVYTHQLVKVGPDWKVAYMKISRLYEEGDRAVLEAAAAR